MEIYTGHEDEMEIHNDMAWEPTPGWARNLDISLRFNDFFSWSWPGNGIFGFLFRTVRRKGLFDNQAEKGE